MTHRYSSTRGGKVAVVVLALLMASAPAGAAQDQADAKDEWASEDRQLEFQSDADEGFEFESTRDTNTTHDVIQGSFDLDTATYRLHFIQEPEEGADGVVPASNGTWFRTSLQFVGLVEFEDRTGDGTFSPLDDEVVDRVELEGYRTPIMTTTTGPDDRTRTVTVEFPFTSGGGLELVFQISPTAHQAGDQLHPPTVTNFEVRLTDYPYARDDTKVALHTQLSSTTGIAPDADASVITIPNGEPDTFDFEGRYAWDSNLEGTNTTVNTTIVELPNEAGGDVSTANVLFAYPRADSINHSANLGFHNPPATTVDTVLSLVGNWYLFVTGIVVAGGIVGGTMYLQLKRGDTQAREI